MRRFLDYYRQFEELPPEEISRELRSRRDAERAVVGVPALDLSGAGWHEPPHPEVVNAATFALRRAVNAYPDASELVGAIARSHDVDPARVVVGHGAGELLRAALRMVAPDGEVLVAWPGWGPLPRLVHEAGATPVPVALDELDRARPARALVVGRPADPTGAVPRVAELTGEHWLILDEALAGFLDDPPLLDHPRVIHVRSFSKAHAMAGLRAGAALGPAELVARLAPSGGVSAPAQAAASWALSPDGLALARRRRVAAHAAHVQLAAALAGSPVAAAPGGMPFAWLSSDAEDGPALAARLAAAQVYVAPGRLWGDERHVRAALRGPQAIDRLAAALRS